jgi:hypothetical protein
MRTVKDGGKNQFQQPVISETSAKSAGVVMAPGGYQKDL